MGDRRRLTLLLGVWTVIGLLLTRLDFQWHAAVGSPITFGQAALRGFGDAYLWGLVTAIATAVTNRFPLGRARWGPALSVHAAVALVVPLARHGAHLSLQSVVGGLRGGYLEVSYFERIFGPYVIILGVVHALHYARRLRERQLAAERLQAELATARLHQLKAQLHPHFLFNTLHAISSLMYSDVRAADRMLSQLAELLRHSLRTFDVQRVPLRQELAFLLPYLEIEQARLGDRLRVELNVDGGLDRALVPHLLLQPLVENAVRHAIAPRPRGGCLQLRIAAQDERLRIEIADDGPGASEAALVAGRGIGLSNTRARLAALHGEDYRMEIESRPEGLTVRIELPLELARERAAEPAAELGVA
jgi:two-component system, LytTR family, sensor kinase